MRKTLVGLLVFVSVGYVFIKSPVHYLSDSRYSLLMDEAILEYGSPNMIAYRVPRYLWTIEMVNGRLLYLYPWGGPLLSLPELAMFRTVGLKVAPQRVYSEENELKMQVYITTVSCAITVWLFYDMAAVTLPVGWSVTIALGGAFGTQVWSTASRNLWPQTWYLLLVSLSLWLLIRSRLRPIVLAWACFARPQGLPVALEWSVFIF